MRIVILGAGPAGLYLSYLLPELVVVVESPVSEARMREMFKAVDGVIRTHPEVGAYNQTI